MDSIMLALVPSALDEQRKSRNKFNDAVVNTTQPSKRIGSGGFPSSSSPLREQQAAVVIYMMAILSGHVVYDETNFKEIVERAKEYGGLNFWWFVEGGELGMQRFSLIRVIYSSYSSKRMELMKDKKEALVKMAALLIKCGYIGNADDAYVCGADVDDSTFGLNVAEQLDGMHDGAFIPWTSASSENLANCLYDKDDFLKPLW